MMNEVVFPKQGDILKKIEYVKSVNIIEGHLKIESISFPYAIVITQSCDLDQASKPNRMAHQDIFSTILLPAYDAGVFKDSIHMLGIESDPNLYNKKGLAKGKDYLDSIENLNFDRYHFIDKNISNTSIDLIVDFKHYFTLHIDNILDDYPNSKIGYVPYLFKEDLSLRFSRYLSRIGLPSIVDYKSEIKDESFVKSQLNSECPKKKYNETDKNKVDSQIKKRAKK